MVEDDEITTADGELDLDANTFRGGPPVEGASIKVPEEGSPDGRNMAVKVQELNGLGIFEGDIALYRVGQPGAKGIRITGDEFRWPNGVMPFVADAEVAGLARAAMRHWEAKTNVRFKERTEETDFVHFKRLNGSWSFVGRQGGEQELSLGATAMLGTAIHEIGHALGLWHEQSRGDRDRHITVNLDKVAAQHRHNFDKHIADGDDVGDYDTNSIMHYPATAFSIDGSPTIVTKNGAPIGQRNGLSRGDIAAAATMYPAPHG